MSDFALVDAWGLKNQDTQYSAENFKRIGVSIIVSPLEGLGALLAPTEWMGTGFFAPDADLAPTSDVQRSPITVMNPMGGQPITLVEDTTEISAIYENLEPVTSDTLIQALHQGSVPHAMTGTLAGSTISPFAPGASILARMMAIRITEGTNLTRRYELHWHPRAAFQNNGFGKYEGRDTRRFRVPIRQWNGEFDDAGILATYNGYKDAMGAIFQGPISELDELVAALKLEAAPTP